MSLRAVNVDNLSMARYMVGHKNLAVCAVMQLALFSDIIALHV